eukprot:4882800-Pyramimonas_sp.AAC.1
MMPHRGSGGVRDARLHVPRCLRVCTAVLGRWRDVLDFAAEPAPVALFVKIISGCRMAPAPRGRAGARGMGGQSFPRAAFSAWGQRPRLAILRRRWRPRGALRLH